MRPRSSTPMLDTSPRTHRSGTAGHDGSSSKTGAPGGMSWPLAAGSVAERTGGFGKIGLSPAPTAAKPNTDANFIGSPRFSQLKRWLAIPRTADRAPTR